MSTHTFTHTFTKPRLELICDEFEALMLRAGYSDELAGYIAQAEDPRT